MLCIFICIMKLSSGLTLITFYKHFLTLLMTLHLLLFFDKSVLPGQKSVIGSHSSDSITCLCQLYSKLYPTHEKDFLEGKVFTPSTFRKYPSISWQGKCLASSLNKNATNSFVFVVPPFSFGHHSNDPEFEGEERLAEVDFFLVWFYPTIKNQTRTFSML